MSQVTSRRRPIDSVEQQTWQLLLKGPMPKDAYLLLGVFRSYDEARLIFDWFPRIPGATIKITNPNGSTSRKDWKMYRFKHSSYWRGGALDYVEQSEELFNVIVKGYLKNQYEIQGDVIDAPLATLDDNLVKIANEETKRTNRIKLMSLVESAAKPFLSLINGSKYSNAKA